MIAAGLPVWILLAILFIGASETLQLVNQMVLIPLKYRRSLSKMGPVSLAKALVAKDRLSFFIVYVLEYSVLISLVAARVLQIRLGFFALPLWGVYLSIAVIVCGEALRLWSTYTLGKFFTYVVLTPKDHRLIAKGPYGFVRHPAYLGGFMIIAGFGLLAQSLVIFTVSIFLICLAYAYRIHVEEQALREKFGKRYESYSERTGMLLPRI